MALFGSRFRGTPFVEPDTYGGGLMEDPVRSQATAEAMMARRPRGLFGGGANAMMVIGAAMKDAAGGDGNLMAVADFAQKRRLKEQQDAITQQIAQQMGGGGQSGGQGGGAAGLSPAMLFQLAASGHPGAQALLTMRGQDQPAWKVGPDGTPYNEKDRATLPERFRNPEAVNDVIVDLNNPANEERHIPRLGEGVTYQRDASGRAIGAAPVAGYAGAVGQIAGEQARATERGRFLGGFHNIPVEGGGAVFMGGDQYAGGNGQQGVQGQPAPGLGRIGITQSPAAQAAATEVAKAGAAGQVDLPGAVQKAQGALDLIEQIRMHPGRRMGTGVLGVLPGIPGTQQRDFVSLVDQAKGQVFLQAFEGLKGGGQITEAEGRAASQAIARLDRAQSPEGFERALNDLEQIIKSGMARAQQRAQQGPSPAATRGPGVRTQGQGFRIIGVE